MRRLGVCVVMLFICSSADCCSTFCLNDGEHVICGRNMDFHVDGGFILVCPKGITKVGLPPRSDLSGFRPIQWTSRYANLTFNIAARELPSSGINEHGLVVNEMTLEKTAYPAADERPALIPLQWIQYQLDNCKSVDEVLATDEEVRVAGFEAGENRGHHFLVSDSSGASAIIEFIDGKRIVHHGQALPWPALTNDTYQHSAEYLAQHQRFGGDRPIQLGPDSQDRFVCLADILVRHELVAKHVDTVNYAFEALAHVAAGNYTVWSIVYEATNRKVYYRTPSHPQIRIIDAQQLFQDAQDPQLVPIEQEDKGDIASHFVDYTTERNLDFARRFMIQYHKGEELTAEQESTVQQIAKYPESFVRSEAAVSSGARENK